MLGEAASFRNGSSLPFLTVTKFSFFFSLCFLVVSLPSHTVPLYCLLYYCDRFPLLFRVLFLVFFFGLKNVRDEKCLRPHLFIRRDNASPIYLSMCFGARSPHRTHRAQPHSIVIRHTHFVVTFGRHLLERTDYCFDFFSPFLLSSFALSALAPRSPLFLGLRPKGAFVIRRRVFFFIQDAAWCESLS